MISIQCPKCGRSGNVPPDRLNARLSCKGCQSVFHMDAGGRMILGEPGRSSSKKAARTYASAPSVDFDLAQTWRDAPKPAKYGVPSACLLVGAWFLMPSFSSGLAYQEQAEVVGRAILSGDRAKVVATATPATAEAAGKWYDLVHAPIAAKSPGAVTNESVHASLVSGTPETSGLVNMSVIIVTDTVATSIDVEMSKEDGVWKIDGAKSLTDAERATPIKLAKKK